MGFALGLWAFVFKRKHAQACASAYFRIKIRTISKAHGRKGNLRIKTKQSLIFFF
jgi:hypothetical protein